jgi:hypothetical protein
MFLLDNGISAPAKRFDFRIDPETPMKDLLPSAPKVAAIPGPVLHNDLEKVPEVDFRAPLAQGSKEDPTTDTAHQIAKINHANAKKTDAFMIALLENRTDLAGMPFALGGACRTAGDRLKYFTQAVLVVRRAQGVTLSAADLQKLEDASGPVATTPPQPNTPPQTFWQRYTALCEQRDAKAGSADKEQTERIAVARIAALTQILAVEPAEIRLGLVKYLAGVSHTESTRALARMAVYSTEDVIREAAITALRVRREKDYTDILVKALRYPWPAVAKRAASAVAKLERKDLVPELIDVLEAGDPRMPTTKNMGEVRVAVVREMVKVNHHRNCLMCHAPLGSGTPNPGAIQAEVAVQGQALPSSGEGYRQSTPELMIRLDVTYLRQDFSAALPVKDAHPWPEAQRFDFFVRERQLTDEEAASYREQLAPKEEGVLSPYHQAAVTALRELTGKDTAPTAAAWRKLLAAPRRD